MSKNFVVAIDGPAGSGKSTSAKLIAQKLGYLYIDTGAMYRTITYLAIKNGIVEDKEAVIRLAEETEIELQFSGGQTSVRADGIDVTEEIRTPAVNSKVSDISVIEGVRKALVKKQQEMGKLSRGVVMEGRDIGTVVFPHADVKIYLTAAIDQRAVRRAKEYQEKGSDIAVDEIKKNIELRDKIDSTRAVSPLTKAPDAFEVDTSRITIEEQVNIILEKIKETADKK